MYYKSELRHCEAAQHARCDPFTRNRESGGWVAKGRIPAILNFDNWMSIQVR
jgi:hypothetical protein